MLAFREGAGAMQFRSKIFLVLALIGVVPAAVLGAMSFSVNRAELERTVGSTQARVAEEAARACERFVAQAMESLRLSASLLPLRDLSVSDLGTVLRIPYRQLEFIDAIWLPGGPLVYEGSNGTINTCCILGYHNSQGPPAATAKTWIYAAYTEPGTFVGNVILDVQALLEMLDEL